MSQFLQHGTFTDQVEQTAADRTDIAEIVTGTTCDDILDLDQRTGHALMHGLGGNDQIVGGSGNDMIRGGEGNDVVQAGSGNDTVCGEDGDDILWGDAGRDVLLGYAGNDRLYGGDDEDVLEGGTGDDQLKGGLGHDVLSGGLGDDLFVFSCGDGADIIRSSRRIRDQEIDGRDTVLFTDLYACGFSSVKLVSDASAGGCDLELRYGDGNVLTIAAQDYGNSRLIDFFRFADRSEMSADDLLEMYCGPGGTFPVMNLTPAMPLLPSSGSDSAANSLSTTLPVTPVITV